MSVLESFHHAVALLPALAKFAIGMALRTFNAAGQPLLDNRMLNAVLIMVLVTAILGPVLTQRFAPGMLQGAPDRPAAGDVPA